MSSLLERVTYDPNFQDACQRYHHSGGSSQSIARAALNAAAIEPLIAAARALLATPAVKPYVRVSPYREIAAALAQIEPIERAVA